MTITAGGSIGTRTSTSTAGTLVLTTSAALNAGEVGVIWIAKNPAEANNTSFSVTDSAGNTWTRIREQFTATPRDTGLFYTLATSTLNSGGTITVTFASGSFTAAALSAQKFTVTNNISLPSTTDSNTSATTNLGITNVDAGYAGGGALALRSVMVVATTGTFTPTSGYTAITAATASTGTTGTSAIVCGEYKISNSAPGNSQPSWSAGDLSNSAMGLLNEPASVSLFMFGPF